MLHPNLSVWKHKHLMNCTTKKDWCQMGIWIKWIGFYLMLFLYISVRLDFWIRSSFFVTTINEILSFIQLHNRGSTKVLLIKSYVVHLNIIESLFGAFLSSIRLRKKEAKVMFKINRCVSWFLELQSALSLVTQPMLQRRLNRTELRSLYSNFMYIPKSKQKIPPPSLPYTKILKISLYPKRKNHCLWGGIGWFFGTG